MSRGFGSLQRVEASERSSLWLVLLMSGIGMAVAYYLVTLHALIAKNPRRGLCTFTDTISCDSWRFASIHAEAGNA